MTKTILVVDDSETAREQVVAVLEPAGYDVQEACDGRDGLRKIARCSPALVICDVHMPIMGGIEMLMAIRDEAKYGAIQSLMLTTEAQPALLADARKAGATGWLVKPFKPHLMLATVRKLIGD
jgi:two-component system, chemotaxis family, chemotaxis protein CheY